MTPTQVHAALGKPEYAERAKTWLGFKTDQVREVYARGVPSKHLYIAPVVIACGNRNGIYDADDGYVILVRYDSDFRVAAFEVVPSWTHGQEPDAPTLPIPQ